MQKIGDSMAKRTLPKYTWAKGNRGRVATRINNNTKEVELFYQDSKTKQWISANYPFKNQTKSVQNKASLIASKPYGYNADKAFKILGRKK